MVEVPCHTDCREDLCYTSTVEKCDLSYYLKSILFILLNIIDKYLTNGSYYILTVMLIKQWDSDLI